MARRDRRDPPARRRHPLRDPQLRVLLVCGARKTESAYLKGLREWLDADSIDVKIQEHSRAPDQVVEFARDRCGYQDFDATWCIVDVDEYEVNGRKLTAASVIARRAGIELAVSNPCFEYWLLLHFVETGAPFPDCNAVAARLRRQLGSYDKAKLRFRDFADGVKAAVRHAKRRDPSGQDFTVNPSSGVWVLIERLLEREE